MKAIKSVLKHAFALLLLGCPAAPAGEAYFLHPPGAHWGALGESNFFIESIAATPEGAVVAGAWGAPEGPDIDYWSVLARIAGDPGTVILTTNFHWEAKHNWAHDIIPVLSGGGTLEGFVFAGAKHRYDIDPYDPRIEWGGAKLWLVRTDTQFVPQWEALEGPYDEWLEGSALIARGTNYLVGGFHHYLAGGSVSGLISAFDSGGVLVSNLVSLPSLERVRDLIPTQDGGYALATYAGIARLTSALGVDWIVGDASPEPGFLPDRYTTIEETASGDLVAVGYRLMDTNDVRGLVLTRLTAGGGVVWSRYHAGRSGTDFVLAADEGALVVDTREDGFNGGTDLRLTKYTADGLFDYEVCLGGEGDDYGHAIDLAADGNYLVAGSADVDGTNRLWVVKEGTNQFPPLVSFTFDPPSPVFRDQAVTFDASASSAPGSAIGSYLWDFGDGTATNGMIVQHAYHDIGTNTITLTVVTTNGVARSATAELEVLGLAIQWERLFGINEADWAKTLVEARDGGFILAGATDTSYTIRNHLWLLKTDRRGRPVWEKFYDGPVPNNDSEGGSCIIRAHDTGYMVAGSSSYYSGAWRQDALLAKVDEDGELVWPIKFLGITNRDEEGRCIIPTADGGYLFAGLEDTNTTQSPWVVKLDGDGNEEWSRLYWQGNTRRGQWICTGSDDGYVLLTDASAYPDSWIKIDELGTPVWTNVGYLYDTWQWIGTRQPPYSGYILVGESGEDIAMKFLDLNGQVVSTRTWTGMTSLQENDIGNYATQTPDGGYLIVGTVGLRPNVSTSIRDDVALVKTDAEGNTHWMEMYPGTTNRDEAGLSAVALTNNSYVVLGRRETGTSRVWLFKVAANHPPEPDLQIDYLFANTNTPLTFDASLSTDRDGTIADYEWDFGDGQTTNGMIVQHAYVLPGQKTIRLTVVDDDDAERSLTNRVFILGIAVSDTQHFTLGDNSITNDPASDPGTYPPEGSALLLDWTSAFGFHLTGTATSSTTRSFDVTFAETLPDDFTLYRLPGWTPIAYTLLDEHTLRVSLWIPAGAVDLTFVLADTHAVPSILATEAAAGARLSLTFDTIPGFRYRIERTLQLAPVAWTNVPHARAVSDPATYEYLDGTGAAETVYVDLPGGDSAFFRISLERTTP
jgi:PKD repeat protein